MSAITHSQRCVLVFVSVVYSLLIVISIKCPYICVIIVRISALHFTLTAPLRFISQIVLKSRHSSERLRLISAYSTIASWHSTPDVPREILYRYLLRGRHRHSISFQASVTWQLQHLSK